MLYVAVCKHFCCIFPYSYHHSFMLFSVLKPLTRADTLILPNSAIRAGMPAWLKQEWNQQAKPYGCFENAVFCHVSKDDLWAVFLLLYTLDKVFCVYIRGLFQVLHVFLKKMYIFKYCLMYCIRVFSLLVLYVCIHKYLTSRLWNSITHFHNYEKIVKGQLSLSLQCINVFSMFLMYVCSNIYGFCNF